MFEHIKQTLFLKFRIWMMTTDNEGTTNVENHRLHALNCLLDVKHDNKI